MQRPKFGFANKHAVDNAAKTNGAPATTANVDPEGFQSVEYKLQKKEKKPRENGDKPRTEYSDKPRPERTENGDKPKFRKEISSEQPKEQAPKQDASKPAEVHEPKKVTAQVINSILFLSILTYNYSRLKWPVGVKVELLKRRLINNCSARTLLLKSSRV